MKIQSKLNDLQDWLNYRISFAASNITESRQLTTPQRRAVLSRALDSTRPAVPLPTSSISQVSHSTIRV